MIRDYFKIMVPPKELLQYNWVKILWYTPTALTLFKIPRNMTVTAPHIRDFLSKSVA